MSLAIPILCLITDRRRLGARLGMPDGAPATTEALLTQVAAAAEAGVGLIQVRDADLPAGALVALVCAIRDRVAGHATRVLVNDRLDVALAGRAHGVHLKSTSVSVAEAASLARPDWLIGRSVHSRVELAAGRARGAHFVVFGTVFPSASKPASWATTGLEGLAAAVQAAGPLPVLAIGGIGPDQAPAVARTGAAGLAAIDAFLPSGPERIADTVQESVVRLRMAFDSAVPLSYDGRQ